MTSTRVDPAPSACGGHVLSIHTSAGERADALAAWVRGGVERSERVVVAAVAQGPVPVGAEHLPAERVFSASALAGLVAAALDDGRRGLRVCVDVESGLSVLAPAEYEEFELALDRLCRGGQVSALCQYAAARTVGPVLRGAVAAHSAGLRAERISTYAGRSGELHVQGEIDEANGETLAGAVRAAAGRAGPLLQVDLSRIDFFGSAGVRALMRGSQAHREAGGRLLLRGAPAHVDRVLRSCEVQRVDGVRLLAVAGR